LEAQLCRAVCTFLGLPRNEANSFYNRYNTQLNISRLNIDFSKISLLTVINNQANSQIKHTFWILFSRKFISSYSSNTQENVITFLKHSDLDLCDDTFITDEDDPYCQRFVRFQYFAGFVNVFYLRRSYPIRNMRLGCVQSHYNDMICNYSFDTWVPSIFGSNLEEEELDIKLYYVVEYNFKVPSSLNNCTNLVSLSQVSIFSVSLVRDFGFK
jgi:hypothetical protein